MSVVVGTGARRASGPKAGASPGLKAGASPGLKAGASPGLKAGASLVLASLVLAACGSGGAGGSSGRAVAWVATQSFQSGPGDTITPVELPRGTVGTPVATASEPAAMAPVTGRRELVVANRGNDTLSVVDTATASVTATVTVGMEPDAVAVAPPGTARAGGAARGPTALVADFGSGTVTPVDLGTMRAGAPIPVGSEPDAVAVMPAGVGHPATALVANFGSDTVTPIDLATLRAGAPIAVGHEPDAIAVVPPRAGHSATALVADIGDDGVTPISWPGLDAGAFIPTPGNPTGIAVAPDGTAWVAGGATLTPLAPATAGSGQPGATVTFSPGRPVPLPGPAESVALDGGTTAWVALQGGSLVPVSLATGRVGKGVTVGGRPSNVVVTPS
ncbi:MAG: YncE family protein [Acidimicrobiales bacterium]